MNPHQAYPLSWPNGWKRTAPADRQNAKFFATGRRPSSGDPTQSYQFRKSRSMEESAHVLYEELRRLGVGDWDVIISSNVELRRDGLPFSGRRPPEDPGAAVYFRLKDKPVSLACDKWFRVEDNIYAIALHVQAIRGQERWGVGSIAQAFAGYMALPAPADMRPWFEVLSVKENCTLAEARAAWIEGCRKCHPDHGGNDKAMAVVNGAWSRAQEVLR